MSCRPSKVASIVVLLEEYVTLDELEVLERKLRQVYQGDVNNGVQVRSCHCR